MCAAFRWRSHSGRWNPDNFERPWVEGLSIYQHIEKHLDTEESRQPDLPDEPRIAADSRVRFAPGALDGVFGHHTDPAEQSEAAASRLRLIKAVMKRPDGANLRAFYESLLDGNVLSYIDPLMEAILEDGTIAADRAADLARWLATNAPDREPVKFAIALLGVAGGESDREVFLLLGRHDEFTLYAALALIHTLPDAEDSLWELGRHVHGWGRVHIIERLSRTQRPDIQHWMLREGYENVMEEYTALPCARTGRMADALAADEIDDDLFTGASRILCTLIDGRGGPGGDIDDYEDAPAAIARYVDHATRRDLTIEHLLTIDAIRRCLGEQGESDERWSKSRPGLLATCARLLEDPAWKTKVTDALQCASEHDFRIAAQVAGILGIDPWPAFFERLKRGEDCWYDVMRTDDPARVDLVIQHAMETLDLASIATGPADEWGLGPQWSEHQKLDWVLQDLRRFPGRGGPLIAAGLQSPVVRNRNMALMALAAWDRDSWTDRMRVALSSAADAEPLAQVRDLIDKVQRGEPPAFE